MPIGAVIAGSVLAPIVGNVVGQAFGGTTQAQAQQQGAGQQVAGLQNAANALNTGYGTAGNALTSAYGNASGTLQPWANLGNQSATQLSNLLGSGYLTNQFSNADLNANLAPNYAFMLGQGQGQVQNAANATGGLISGNTLQGLNTFTQNYAQNAYQQAFNNYQAQRQNIYGDVAGAAGIGQSGSNALANLMSGYGASQAGLNTNLAQSLAGNYGQQGTATGAGTVGAGTTLAQMYNSVGPQLGAAYNAYNIANNPAVVQAQLTAGGYGSNALNNIPSSAVQGNSNFIGPSQVQG
jgi:hypothetical protein